MIRLFEGNFLSSLSEVDQEPRISRRLSWPRSAGIADQKKTPLFRSIDRHRTLTDRPMHRNDALRMIKRRCKAAGLPDTICNHSFRATGITTYRANGSTLEKAQEIANHASPKTTKLYDRTSDQITLDEVERIVI